MASAAPVPEAIEPVSARELARPMRDVLREFAQPVLALGQSNGRARDAEAALARAALVWDLAVAGLPCEEIVELAADTPDARRAVEALVRRKRLFFADDRRPAAGGP